MKDFEIVIQNSTGLHARPAKKLANLAKAYQSNIQIQHGEKKINAKSLISILTLGVEGGSTIRITIDGADEEIASRELYQAIEEGLGETEPVQQQTLPNAAETASVSQPVVEDKNDSIIKGVPCSPGISIGPLFQYIRPEIKIKSQFQGVAEESDNFRKAVATACLQLEDIRKKMASSLAQKETAIIEVHIDLLNDSELIKETESQIESGQAASSAWHAVIEKRAAQLQALNDPYLAARVLDLKDVENRVQRILVGAPEETLVLPDYPVIITATDLSPSDAAGFDPRKTLGFCLAGGGTTSHTAIIARALGIPAVVNMGAALLEVKNDTEVVLDGRNGSLLVQPDENQLAQARQIKQQWQDKQRLDKENAAEPAITPDGRQIEVVANIGGIKDACAALKAGAEGVGLLRTEFLFLDREQAPDEAEQHEIYTQILTALQGHPVLIRTMDIGGDKPLPYIKMAPEANPFLGVRGLRLSLIYPDLFRQQLRAILRAVPNGRVRLMFPMVADIEEWRAARRLVEEVRKECASAGMDTGSSPVEMGIMIEVPSAALLADVFAREVDFFSIGTNDLTQYTLAMDRGNPALAAQSDGLHPAVLRLISMTVEAAHREKRWVGVCGELGADPQALPVLLGLGVDELSVNLNAIAPLKAQLRKTNYQAAQDLAKKALTCETAHQVRSLSASFESESKN
ncbi:MAG: phosphoenolpyruvate--protein phosphotransferase [Anaerolineae bacterium]|nr:phosphoenolpyruvate--protein phosphotransferase [Anaerolineae bacterium]